MRKAQTINNAGNNTGTENGTMTEALKTEDVVAKVTMAQQRNEILAGFIPAIIELAKGKDKASDIAEALFASCGKADSHYRGPSALRTAVRDAIADSGYKPRSRTREYFTLTNTLTCIVAHYARKVASLSNAKVEALHLQGWVGSVNDSETWDWESSADAIVKKHKDDSAALKLFVERIQENIG